MSYAAPILRSLPETFRSSTNLAILASLGIHGLLWVVLPMISFSSKSVGPSQRTVGLVQLTPDELSRLPRASSPPVELPAFATQPSALPPLPPPPDLSLLQQIPSGTTNYKDLLKVPFQPQFQTLAPLSSVPGQNNAVPFKPDKQINLVPFKFDDKLTPPPPPSLEKLPPPPPSLWRQPSNRQMSSIPIKPEPLPDFVLKSPALAPTTPAQGNNTPITTPNIATNTTDPNSPVVIPNTGAKIPQRAINELLARREQLREQSSQENSNNSTLVALTEDLRKWFTDVKPTSWQKVAISPTYPKQACPRQLEGTASIVALLDSKGNFINGPRLNKTTGYDILDQAALATVKAHQFKPKSDERQGYGFELEFKYDRASCATPQPTPENRNATPQPTPENRNATPQPTLKKRNSLQSILEERNATPQPKQEFGSPEQPQS